MSFGLESVEDVTQREKITQGRQSDIGKLNDVSVEKGNKCLGLFNINKICEPKCPKLRRI